MDEVNDGTAVALPTATDRHRQHAAERVIRSHVWWSAGAGLIPVAFADMAAISLVQLDMLNRLAKLYDVPFDRHLGKSAVATLIGSVLPVAVGHGYLASAFFQSFARSAPVIGPVVGLATVGGFAAAATYAVGRVFNQHFASGGTFLTFDPKKVEARFREQFEAARNTVAAESAAA
jgi:uncharacterized protein (DUF697 family)